MSTQHINANTGVLEGVWQGIQGCRFTGPGYYDLVTYPYNNTSCLSIVSSI